MKKTCFLAVFWFAATIAHAQDQWKDMEWQTYGMEFQVPDEFQITESTGKIFTATGDGFTLSIQPWVDSTLSAEQVAQKTQESLEADDVQITSREKVDLKGYEGYELIGSGKQEGKEMLFVILGFIDPEGDTNFSAYILFWNDEISNDKNIKIAEHIVESIGKAN